MNSPQAPVLQLSSPPSVDTKLLFVMFLALQSYLLTLLVAMLPNVATQLAKFAALPVVLRASVQSILSGTAKLPSLAELLGLLSRRHVQTHGALMPILLKEHPLPKS